MRKVLRVLLIAGWTAALLPAQLRITGLDGLAAKATKSVDITLDSSLLQMAGGFLAGNGKIKDLLSNLKAITVKSFEFKEDGQYRIEDLEPIRAQLRSPGWSKIVSAQSKGEISEIYTRGDQGKVVGFAIIAAKPRELAVVAIEGSIDLADLAKLGGLGVPAIPVPDQNKKGKQQ
jgi:hypothetical protein